MDLDVFEWVGTRVSMSLSNATAVVQFFNPPHGYMDEAMEAELAMVLDRLEHWPQGRVVILTGRDPGVFIRHYDVAILHKRAQFFQAKGKKFSMDRPVPNGGIHDCLERIDKSPLIFIAAINGVAMGGASSWPWGAIFEWFRKETTNLVCQSSIWACCLVQVVLRHWLNCWEPADPCSTC